MVSLDKAVIARLKSYGETFEILVDSDLALEYKSGENIKLNDVMAVDNIFKDAKTGDKSSEESLKKVFGTDDVLAIADRIIKKGELHLTTEQRKRMLEDRKKQIVTTIARNAINPQTKLPHPPGRIEKAMEEARVDVNINESAKEQVDRIVKALQPIIPIKFGKIQIAVKIPANYAGKLHSTFREFGDVKKEEWVGGEQYCVLEIPAGLQDEFLSKINNLTKGEANIKFLR